MFDTLKDKWGELDFVIHAIAYSDKNELQGRYVDTTLDNFLKTIYFAFLHSVMRRAKN